MEPFAQARGAVLTPRGWHMLSDALHWFGDGITDDELAMIAYGALASHAGQFVAFNKQLRGRFQLERDPAAATWAGCRDPSDRDVLYYLAQSFRARLIKELPSD